MQSANKPGKLVLPFAATGSKRTIPATSQIGITAGAASLPDGFPPLTMIPETAGGVGPSGMDMNGILYELSAITRWANAGGGYPYDAAFAADPNVGGYPKGARVMRTDGQGYWLNTVDDNATDPESGGAGWVPDFSYGASSITMTSTNYTLSALEYGKPIIVVSGLLTANLNLIFPNVFGQWVVIDNTTGPYSITAKTAAGTGVLLSKVTPVVCDSANIKSFSVPIITNVMDYGVTGNGVTDDTANILIADAVGGDLVFPKGTYLITANTTFTSRVVMMNGAIIKTSSSSIWINFSGGFSSGLNYCLDIDGPTKFISIEKIYPQWFGNCGLTSQDSSIPLQRAFRAARDGMDGVSATTDAAFGCVNVHFIRGDYRCNDVDVYCQTIVTGEVTGAINGSYITQIDRTKPALRVHAKNYTLANTVSNNSNGINTFHRVTFRAEQISDGDKNEYVVRFYSPTESTALLAIPGDSVGGNIGHVDTMFERCWFQFTPSHAIGVEDGRLSFWLKQCTFDVVRGGVRFSGTSYGKVFAQECQIFQAVRSYIHVDTTTVANPVDVILDGGEMGGAGNCGNLDSTYRNSIYYNPTGSSAGRVMISNKYIRSIAPSGNKFGGPIYVRNSDIFSISDCYLNDLDTTGLQKFMSIESVQVYISDVKIKSLLLASYTNSRVIAFSSNPAVMQVANVSIYNASATPIVDGIQSDVPITGASFDVRFSGPFTSKYNSNIAANGQPNSITGLTVVKYGTAAPVTGTWSAGDRVINSAPTVGQPKAWTYTVAGAWVSEGNL